MTSKHPSKTPSAPKRPTPRSKGRADAALADSPRGDGPGGVPGALLRHGEAALEEALQFTYPADGVLSHYFREHRELGHKDRGFVAEAVFGVLRRLRSLSARAQVVANPVPYPGAARPLLLAWLATNQGWNLRQLEPLLVGGEGKEVTAAKALDENTLAPAVRHDLPDWLDAAWAAQYGEAGCEQLAQALRRSAPLDLRVNTLKLGRDEVLAQLQAAGIAAEATPWSPLGIRLEGKPGLQKHPLFLDGSFEVQDEGSQLLGLLLAPKRGEMVLDFCAGAGGKTLLLGALMRNTGRLYAADVSEKRLAKLKPRLARSGLSNVHPLRIEHEGDSRLKRLHGKFDRVLVDAPCSGLGTLRRNPDLKWRQSDADVAELAEKQFAILSAAARMVRPGGRLVYATCSLLAAENEAVVGRFLEAHPEFAAAPARDTLAAQGITLPASPLLPPSPWLQLLPTDTATDGFFAALLERQTG